MDRQVPRPITFLMILLLGIGCQSCATASTADAAEAEKEAATSTEVATDDAVESNAGAEATVDSGTSLDGLARDLAEVTVYRTHESITVRLPDEKFFEPTLQKLTSTGNALISDISDILLRYPDTRIYIQSNVAENAPDRSEAMEEALLIQAALRDRGIDINRLEVDITTPAEPRKPLEVGGRKLEPKRFFELNIIPRV